MPIKAVICDIGGTLYNEHAGRAVDGIREMIDRLHELGIYVFAISNRPRITQAEAVLDNIPQERFLYQIRKGSRQAVQRVKEAVQVNETEIVLLGDDEQDMHEASNNNLVYFNAGWSNPDYEYGISISSPGFFVKFLQTFFLKDNYWYWSLDDEDEFMRPLTVRAMLNSDVAELTRIKGVLKGYMADGQLQGFKTRDFLILHFIASVFLDGVIRHKTPRREPVWCLYPGATGESNKILVTFEAVLTRLLRGRFSPNLIVRHTPAASQKFARARRETPLISDQFSTISLNPNSSHLVEGNTVFVVDDFTTEGNAFETARNLLYAAGAKNVVCLAVGKYSRPHLVTTPNLHLTPFDATQYRPEHFRRFGVPGTFNQAALTPFHVA